MVSRVQICIRCRYKPCRRPINPVGSRTVAPAHENTGIPALLKGISRTVRARQGSHDEATDMIAVFAAPQ